MDLRCVRTGSRTYTVTGVTNQAPQSGKYAIFSFWGKSQNANGNMPYSTLFRFHADEAKRLCMSETTLYSSSGNASPISSVLGFYSAFSVSNEEPTQVYDLVRGDYADFHFRAYFSATLTASHFVDIQFPNGVNFQTGAEPVCLWRTHLTDKGYGSSECRITQSSPMKIRMRPPINPTSIPNQWWNIYITSKCGTQSNLNGLKWDTHGKQTVSVYFNGVW